MELLLLLIARGGSAFPGFRCFVPIRVASSCCEFLLLRFASDDVLIIVFAFCFVGLPLRMLLALLSAAETFERVLLTRVFALMSLWQLPTPFLLPGASTALSAAGALVSIALFCEGRLRAAASGLCSRFRLPSVTPQSRVLLLFSCFPLKHGPLLYHYLPVL